MIIEARLEKPAKPEKWDLPADISLKSAMARAKEESQSRFDGTLAVTQRSSFGSCRMVGAGATKKRTVVVASKPPPRHERFFAVGTNLSLVASLHRKLLPIGELRGPSADGAADGYAAEESEEEQGVDEEDAAAAAAAGKLYSVR